MNTSSRFIVATHILSALGAFKLATGKYQTLKSDFISASVNTNPVVVRRILGMLKKAGLVTSQTGPEGGTRLARHPNNITLLEIYDAVEDGAVFHLHYRVPNQNCPIGYNIQSALCGVFADAQSAIKKVLVKRKLADVVRDILDRSGISKKLEQGLTPDDIRQNFDFRSGKWIEKETVSN